MGKKRKKVGNKGVGGSTGKKILFEYKTIKMLKSKAFCGKYKRNRAACIRNAENFLVA